MKKVFFAIAIATSFVSCNNAATTETAVDSTKIKDSIANIAGAAKNAVDSTAKKADSTIKAIADTAKVAVKDAAKKEASKMEAPKVEAKKH